MNVYENCKIYGPYVRKKDGRRSVFVVFPNGTKKTISYPKYLMEIKIGRYLNPDETVDHLDMNIDNDEYSNLVIKTRLQHIQDDAIRLKEQNFICPQCNSKFSLSGKKLGHAISNRKKNKAGPFCSKRCAGIYGTLIQHGRQEKLEAVEIIPKYSNNKGFEFEKRSNIHQSSRKNVEHLFDFTDEQVIELRELYNKNLITLNDIKIKFDIKRINSVKDMLIGKTYSHLPNKIDKSFFGKDPYFKTDDKMIGEWIELYQKNISIREIGRMYNVDHSTVSYHLKKKFKLAA